MALRIAENHCLFALASVCGTVLLQLHLTKPWPDPTECFVAAVLNDISEPLFTSATSKKV